MYQRYEHKEESIFYPLLNIFQKVEKRKLAMKNNIKKNTLLIHIHGGGFIGSKTIIHEPYLRKWANNLGIPIIGINYSLAPKYPYPEGLNDLYQAYMWILKNAKEELCLDIKNIIISGDSAGANLVFSLVFLLITINQYENKK